MAHEHKWHVAFHGTKLIAVLPILKHGCLLKPGELTLKGGVLKPPDHHIQQPFDRTNKYVLCSFFHVTTTGACAPRHLI